MHCGCSFCRIFVDFKRWDVAGMRSNRRAREKPWLEATKKNRGLIRAGAVLKLDCQNASGQGLRNNRTTISEGDDVVVCTGGINPLGETDKIGVFVEVVDFNFTVKRRGKTVAGRVRLTNA